MIGDYISIQRQIRKHWLWEEKRPRTKYEAWTDMLMMANYKTIKKPYNDQVVTIQRGEFPTSFRSLALRWGWSKNTVVKFIKLLKSDTMIDTHSNYGFTLVKIINYEKYQSQADTDPGTVGNTVADTVGDTVGGTTIIKNNKDNKENKFRAKPKNLEMVVEYFLEKNIPDAENNAEKFYSHYESVGWFRGKSKIKNWKMCVKQWNFQAEVKQVQEKSISVEHQYKKTPLGEFMVFCQNVKCKSYGDTLFAKNKFDIQKGCRCGYEYQPTRPKVNRNSKSSSENGSSLSDQQILEKIGFNMKTVA